ncbi:hypothetical protein IMSHALPRED_009884 [Imshaugia aleurites]|uniref:F-box domain-containing protein n=1 Tax=Imshaugia aleurites TaxID=172621 RepID=A0A8H3G283_9LECA|nr:hypothetical protein IMSHALPRED_009884 [Imshaugia aleurites]
MCFDIHDLPTYSGKSLGPRLIANFQSKKKYNNKTKVSTLIHQSFLEPRMQNQNPRTSIFQKLPTEIIVLVMCHTSGGDLVNLIQTEKSVNDIFQEHKMSIFKRMQLYQFQEFSGWFGDLPGFDGSILANKRTPDQIQCLKGAVFAFDWRIVVAAPSGNEAAEEYLRLLEQYGGWRYLHFLGCTRRYVEEETENLYIGCSREMIPTMNQRSARAIVLCLSRMSWMASKDLGSEAEEPADMAARVETRLNLFQQEPPTLQELMVTTLMLLIYHIADRLHLADIVSMYLPRGPPAGFANPTPVQRADGFCSLSSETMSRLLLECCLFHGRATVMQLCMDPVNDQVSTAQSWIKGRFQQEMLGATFGAVPDDPCIQEGSLWVAGLKLPTSG